MHPVVNVREHGKRVLVDVDIVFAKAGACFH